MTTTTGTHTTEVVEFAYTASHVRYRCSCECGWDGSVQIDREAAQVDGETHKGEATR